MVATFDMNYHRHFFINFNKLCAHLAANFLNFPKHPWPFTFWWFWRMLWPKFRKLRNQKICQFEPTLKSSLFSEWIFKTFSSSVWPKSTIFDSQKSPKTKRKLHPYNVSVICCQSLTDVLQHPVDTTSVPIYTYLCSLYLLCVWCRYPDIFRGSPMFL